jgi:hypothetical protein
VRKVEGARESTRREGAKGLWRLHDKQHKNFEREGRHLPPGAQLAGPAQLVQLGQLVPKAITWTPRGNSRT